MLKILIIDDDSNKISNIVKLLKEKQLATDENINFALDATNGRKMLHEESYDLLILDMNLPTSIGEDPSRDGGLQLLEKIHTNQILNYPHHIIGVTGYQDIFEDSKNILEQYLWTLIHYDNTNIDWQDKIVNKVKYLIESKQNTYGNNFKKFDIAVVTALDKIELEAVLKLPFNWKELKIPNDQTTNYHEGIIELEEKKYSIVAASASRMGMVASSILTTKISSHFHPEYIFMVGIAAGIKGKNNFGDILVAEYSWDWGSGKKTSSFLPDHAQMTLDETIVAKLKHINSNQSCIDNIKNNFDKAPDTTLKMHIGPIASGASVLEDALAIEEIKVFQRKLIGIDMEIYGVMSAIKYGTSPFSKAICIKSVCDFGDDDKNDDWQHYAAYTSTEMMNLLIQELYKSSSNNFV